MNEIKVNDLKKQQIRWAINQEFEVMAEIDPVFRPEFMSAIRRYLWKYMGLPSLYKRAEGYLAEIDGEKAGFTFSYIRPIMIRIDSFVVLSEHRKKGVGSELLGEIEGFAEEYEIRYLVIAIPRENPVGYEFAKKKGFKPYRNLLLRLDDASKLGEPSAKVEVEKLISSIAKDQYSKWFYDELKNGDAWAYDLIHSEFAELGFNDQGTHWGCMLENENKGYLRLINNAGKLTVYLACEEEYWDDKVQLDWIRAAIEEADDGLESIEIMFASGGHHKVAKELFSGAGFEEAVRQRFLTIKDLGPISSDEDENIDDKD